MPKKSSLVVGPGKHSAATLFHYTTTAGLHGIVHSGEVWASHLNYSNDSAELRYGMELLHEVLRKETRGFPQEWRDFLREGIPLAVARGEAAPNAYAFSLTEEGDLLSQWRAYADTGSGYSIGFDPEGLRMMTVDGHPNTVRLLQVEYKPSKQTALLVDVIRPILRELRTAVENTTKATEFQAAEQLGEGVGNVSTAIWEVLGRLKHPGFAEEREWRLVVHHPSTRGAHYRIGRNGIVPFLVLRPAQGKKLPITRVITGPALDRVTQGRALRGLLDVHGLVAAEEDPGLLGIADLVQGRIPTVLLKASSATFRR